MKTVIIWDNLEANLKFIVVDGDKSHLDRVYINQAYVDAQLQDELSVVIYNQDTYEPIVDFLDVFPVLFGLEVKVIVAGFLP